MATVTPAPAPPLDRPLTYRIEQQRPDDGVRFALTRQVTFRRSADGLTAEVAFVGTEAVDGPATDFVRGTRAFRGRPLRFHFSPAGGIVALDDPEGAWATLPDGVTAMAHPGNDPAAALRALPADRRLVLLASQLTPVLAGDLAAVPGGGPVTLPVAALAGCRGVLTGTRTVSRGRDGSLTLCTPASGTLDYAGVTLERTQVIDPVAGLIVSRHEVTRATLAGVVHTVIATAILAKVSQYPSATWRKA